MRNEGPPGDRRQRPAQCTIGPILRKSDNKSQTVGRVNDVGKKLLLRRLLEGVDVFDLVLHEQSARFRRSRQTDLEHVSLGQTAAS